MPTRRTTTGVDLDKPASYRRVDREDLLARVERFPDDLEQAFRDARKPMGWEHSRFADFWNQFHGGFVAVTLAVATLLTVSSFAQYLYRNRGLFSRAR